MIYVSLLCTNISICTNFCLPTKRKIKFRTIVTFSALDAFNKSLPKGMTYPERISFYTIPSTYDIPTWK